MPHVPEIQKIYPEDSAGVSTSKRKPRPEGTESSEDILQFPATLRSDSLCLDFVIF